MVRISDYDIVRVLMDNARLSYVKIAEIFGVSEAAIRKRVKKLEKAGVIKKYTVEVDPRKLGFEIKALIGVDSTPERFIHLVNELKTMDNVISLYTASGDHMIIIECWFKNSGELSEFIKLLEEKRGVTRVCPAIILEKIK